MRWMMQAAQNHLCELKVAWNHRLLVKIDPLKINFASHPCALLSRNYESTSRSTKHHRLWNTVIITFRHKEVSFSIHSETALMKFSETPFSGTGVQFTTASTASTATFFHILTVRTDTSSACLILQPPTMGKLWWFPKYLYEYILGSPLLRSSMWRKGLCTFDVGSGSNAKRCASSVI